MRRITEILKSGPRTPAEQNRVWKYQEKKSRIADWRGTQAYMQRMDAPSYTAKHGVGFQGKGDNPSGARSVTLRNMRSVTIIRRRNGTVGIRGVKK